MRIRSFIARRLGVLGLAMAVGACSLSPATLSVDHAWVRLPAVPGRPAAAYFTVHGGAAPVTLIAVSSDFAVRGEMHRSMQGAGGMMAMAPLARVTVPAGGTVAFAPGGRHVMLFGVNPGLKPGGTTTLTLTFADGTRMPVRADAVAAGDPAPAA